MPRYGVACRAVTCRAVPSMDTRNILSNRAAISVELDRQVVLHIHTQKRLLFFMACINETRMIIIDRHTHALVLNACVRVSEFLGCVCVCLCICLSVELCVCVSVPASVCISLSVSVSVSVSVSMPVPICLGSPACPPARPPVCLHIVDFHRVRLCACACVGLCAQAPAPAPVPACVHLCMPLYLGV